ncbi:Lipoprotein OS=Streptomyces microflavus OX=1919 GN=Smic_19000 PE=4 SV=1 [Streptomyces microflavus]
MAPEFVEKPTAPTPSGDRKTTSYAADGRTLEVTFWGGVCSTYTASAEESPGQVRISIAEKPQKNGACIMIAKELKRTVTLDAPLGDRTVIDAASGATVPRS